MPDYTMQPTWTIPRASPIGEYPVNADLNLPVFADEKLPVSRPL